MPGFLTLWPMALRRLRARWRLLLPLLVGSILAVALLSSTVIYGDGVRQLGLEHSLRQDSREQMDIDLLSYYNPTEVSAFQRIQNEMEVAISRNVDWFVEGSTQAMKGSTLFVNQVARGGAQIEPTAEAIEGAEAAKVNPRLRALFLFRSGFGDRTTLLSGELPPTVIVERDERGIPTSSPEIPALILEETAHAAPTDCRGPRPHRALLGGVLPLRVSAGLGHRPDRRLEMTATGSRTWRSRRPRLPAPRTTYHCISVTRHS